MSARARTDAARLAPVAWLVVLAGCLAGCEDDLPKATEIVHMRMLGAKLEVVGDETRATPEPGQSVRVTLPTVFPGQEERDPVTGSILSLQDKQRRLRSLIIGCTAPDRYTGGIPICQELIDIATGVIETPEGIPAISDQAVACFDNLPPQRFGPFSFNCPEGTPVMEFPIPADYRRNRLLFTGIVCERGTPFLRADQEEPFACCQPPEGDRPDAGEEEPDLTKPFVCKEELKSGEAIRVHGLIPVQLEKADTNLNPDISALSLVREINGPWKPVDPSLLTPKNDTDCKSVSDMLAAAVKEDNPASKEGEQRAGLPLLYGHIDLDIVYDDKKSKREQFEGKPEPLEISLYATEGEMERRFTVFEPDEELENGQLRTTLRYTPPKKDIPEGGQLARFYATVRDQRGGFSIAEYALCLGPLATSK